MKIYTDEDLKWDKMLTEVYNLQVCKNIYFWKFHLEFPKIQNFIFTT